MKAVRRRRRARPPRTPAPLALAGVGATAVIAAGVAAIGAVERPREIVLDVRYPERNRLVVPDSNFLFGSIGTPTGTLSIDGTPVRVASNGAFLAWLPVPAATRGDTAVYDILAVEGADTARLRLPVLRPRTEPPPGAASPWLDGDALDRMGDRWYAPGDELTFEVTGSAGASVHLQLGGARFELEDLGTVRGSLVRYEARFDPVAVHEAACREARCRAGIDSLPGADGGRIGFRHDTILATLVARDGPEATRAELRLVLAVMPDPAPAVRLREADDPVNGRSTVVVGRPTPFGPYRWRFAEGTVAAATGRLGDRVGLDLGGGLAAWVNAEDLEWLGGGRALEPARTHDARVTPAEDRVDLRVGLTRAVPTDVVVTGPRSLRLVLFGTYGDFGRIALGGPSAGVRGIRWSQLPGPTVHVDMDLDWPVWGHRLRFGPGDPSAYEGPGPDDEGEIRRPGTVLTLSVRRPPVIDPDRPLRHRRIAVDPGHPGAGSTGPTGLYEGDANLAIARRLVSLLEDAGAEPVIIRDHEGAVGLYERTRIAREGGAELFISIHNNALPDGVRPFDRAGTGTYYYHPHSAALAAAVQSGLVARLGLPDLGVLWGDLAVAREPWMPAVLAEGAFMMIPSHEMALRTPQFRERYALGILEGLERFLRETAESTP